jgi:hypothetical protein
VLYGLDLENAVDRRVAFDKRTRNEQSKKVLENDFLRKKIAQKREELDELKRMKETMRLGCIN